MANEEVKKILSSLIISCPMGITVKKLYYDYKEITGENVPFNKFGFTSFEQFLLSVPDICRINGHGNCANVIPVVNEQNKHINEMVLKQKPPKINTRFKPNKRSRGIYNHSTNSNFCEPPRMKKQQPVLNLPVTNPNAHKKILPPPDDYGHNTNKQINSNSCINLENNDNKETSANVAASINYDFSNMFANEQFDSDISDFDNEEFKYKSDDEELSTCVQNMVQIKEEENPLTSYITIQPKISENDIKHESRINDRVKEKLEILVSENPDGIWCSKLIKLYYERFKQKLDPYEYGFTSVIQLCGDLPDILHCVRVNRMDWKIYDKRKPIPDLHSIKDVSKYLQSMSFVAQNQVNTEPPLPVDIPHLNSNFTYPEDVMKPDEKIERQWLINNKKINDYIELVVSEVYDPSKFWIQLRGSTTSFYLDKIMDEMQHFYKINASKYQLNEFSVRIGLFCAALFMNEYHRAIVIKVFDDKSIKVFYIDYGTVDEVSLRKTCFLHKKFTELPQQAIRARLYNIIPAERNTMWPREASNFMLQLVMEKNLIGLINGIDETERILHLIVSDTNLPDKDIHINDELVKVGYAIIGNEAPMCVTSNAVLPNIHVYPSFEEIENGVYPSVRDIIHLLKIGQTYEMIFHGYFELTNLPFSKPTTTPIPTKSLESNNSSFSLTDSPTKFQENQSENNYLTDFELSESDISNLEESSESTVSVAPGFENFTPNNENILNFFKNFASNIPLNQNSVKPIQPFFYPFQNHETPCNSMLHNNESSEVLGAENFYQDLPLSEAPESIKIKKEPTNMYERFLQGALDSKETISISPDHLETENETIPKNSEHNIEHSVLELKIGEYLIHVIKMEDNFYVISQEIIANFFKSNLPFKKWLISMDFEEHIFPNRLINLAEQEDLHNEIKKYSIPGVYPANNLGCNVRITLLLDVIKIIKKYVNTSIIEELNNHIKNIIKTPPIWKSLHSFD